MTGTANQHDAAVGDGTRAIPDTSVLPFLWRLAIVSTMFVGLTYGVGLPGEPMPDDPLALLSLPIVPILLLMGPVGFPISLFTIPTLFTAVCYHCQRRNTLLFVGALTGIINGLLVRWCLYLIHALAT